MNRSNAARRRRISTATPSSNELCFFPVDNTKAVDTTGIADVLGTINVLAEEQVRVREERPLSWLKVLDELQSLSETANYIYLRNRQRRMGRRSASADESMPTIHFDIDLWTIAQAHRVRVDHFDALVEFFDAVGIFKVCRSKRDKTGRHDVVVLRPQWLVNMFTAVITCCHGNAAGIQRSDEKADLALDLYRFESKAILSLQLLRHLLAVKGAVATGESEDDEGEFELILELMLRFDLMFELKGADNGQASDNDNSDTTRSCFLVPAMLTDSIDSFPQYSAAAAPRQRSEAPRHVGAGAAPRLGRLLWAPGSVPSTG